MGIRFSKGGGDAKRRGGAAGFALKEKFESVGIWLLGSSRCVNETM